MKPGISKSKIILLAFLMLAFLWPVDNPGPPEGQDVYWATRVSAAGPKNPDIIDHFREQNRKTDRPDPWSQLEKRLDEINKKIKKIKSIRKKLDRIRNELEKLRMGNPA